MKIVAAVDDSSAAAVVVRVASALAERLDGEVVALHARAPDDEGHAIAASVAAADDRRVPLSVVDGRPVPTIVDMLTADDVVVGVIGLRGHAAGKLPAGHTVTAVVTATRTPLVVVPPTARGGAIRRILVPLDGTASGATVVDGLVTWLARGGATLVAAHVFVPETVPRCWDQAHHASRAWSTSFLARYGPPTPHDLLLRGGDVADALLDIVDQEAIDLVALVWSQDLTGRHAPVVRALLARCSVPVLLIPLAVGA